MAIGGQRNQDEKDEDKLKEIQRLREEQEQRRQEEEARRREHEQQRKA